MNLKLEITRSTLIVCIFLLGIGQMKATTSIPRSDIHEVLEIKEELRGTVRDANGEPLAGVVVAIEGTTTGVLTDDNGKFSIPITTKKETLVFSLLGFKRQVIVLDGRDGGDLNIILEEETYDIGQEVVVVGFGKQKKESMVSSITTINVKELKGPTSNLTTMLAGRISGIIAYQRSGEPGKDNSDFFIRGVGTFGSGKRDPLILIDGIESSQTDLARLQPDDMESFSVLKDATAASVYGARGANGVVIVTTKGGDAGKTQFSFRVENSLSGNTNNFKFADNITYMKLANEAALTRDPLAALTYSQSKIAHTIAGDDPLLYPNNNWIDLLIKPTTMNQRYNVNIKGGGSVVKFYIAGTYNVDNGILRSEDSNGLKNNINLKNYSIRSNTNVQLTKTTEAIVRVYGQFDDYTGPRGGAQMVFEQALRSNPVMFPAIYPASYSPYKKHPLFGNAVIPGTQSLYNNPYAHMVSNYQQSSTANLMTQIEFNQNLKFILPGLSARAMGYTQRNSYFRTERQFRPYYYQATMTDGEIYLKPLNDGQTGSIGDPGEAYLRYEGGAKSVNNTYYGEGAINYAATFSDKHDVSGMLIGIVRNYINGDAGSLEQSLPSRNLGVSGRFTYGYDKRYMVEFNFGYNGSERFAKNHRWGFFPSIGGGWNISNESFFSSLSKTVSNLKLRTSYGLVGNDQIGDPKDRFFYVSQVNMSDGNKGATFGTIKGRYRRDGISSSRYANPNIGWEESRQLNLGLDATLFDLNVTIDAYDQRRSHIYMNRAYIPGTLGLQSNVAANIGKAKSSGIDVALDYNKQFKNGIWTQLRANLTYATSEKLVWEEAAYAPNEYYRTQVGQSNSVVFGLIAERLFVDDVEVANSPTQNFGNQKVLAGDIKYRDMNGDGQITDADKVPIGYPSVPEIIYGFGGTIGYKQFDFSLFVQGSARSSLFINPNEVSPFVQRGLDQHGLLKVIAEDHWSEDNRNVYAFWPRLGNTVSENNRQTSTWWMRDGAFLRLKTVNIGYNLSDKLLTRLGLSNFRIYMDASNLFVISKFKMWDPEMGGNGLGYPVQRVYNLGVSFTI
ncbi:MAG: SusC/RagA family TonB-linked outer membrane protein [Dysgonomonas sp.]